MTNHALSDDLTKTNIHACLAHFMLVSEKLKRHGLICDEGLPDIRSISKCSFQAFCEVVESEEEEKCVAGLRERLFTEGACLYMGDEQRHPQKMSIGWSPIIREEISHNIMCI